MSETKGAAEVVREGVSKWFPFGREESTGWRFDAISLLAIIGESSVADHSQLITASAFCLLPRIIPAPQALLKPERPSRLPETTAKLSGVFSGITLDSISFFANIIHPLEQLPSYGFKMLEITYADHSKNQTNADSNGDSEGKSTSAVTVDDAEAGVPKRSILRRRTAARKVADSLTLSALHGERPAVPPNLFSPLHLLSLFSFLLTMGLIAGAAVLQDANAILSLGILSIVSMLVGFASWWKPLLQVRKDEGKVPKGDVVIRTRSGAILLVRCSENIARELYSGTEECEYELRSHWHRTLMGVGTMLLMLGIVLLGNCTWNMQVAIGASYIVLNGLYWAIGLIPREKFWDLSRYNVRDLTPPDARNADVDMDTDDGEGAACFTRTLWYAVRETESQAWVERSGAAPGTAMWRQWLDEAQQAAKTGDRKWKPVARKDALLRGAAPHEHAENHAPLMEVEPKNTKFEDTSAPHGAI
jgi:hypothetical protein